MKKIIGIIFWVLCGALTVSADIGFESWVHTWNHAGIYDVGGVGSQGPWVSTGKVQLVWSMDGIQADTSGVYPVEGGTPLPGEYVLEETYTTEWGTWNETGNIYSNSAVGGTEINSGYVFTRVFQTASASAGGYFLDIGEVNATDYL